MEQKQKNEKSLKWVELVQAFPPIVQQSIGNLCSTVLQQLATIACFSVELFDAVCDEVKVAIKDSTEGVASEGPLDLSN